ncbi:OmpA/MotB family protein [Mucisphaera sp.]|uniref:OmpA/MotB family protein n=1 Tax=Mucisphaera sp. TaxID=2913024 RepID=UPI003D0E5CA3
MNRSLLALVLLSSLYLSGCAAQERIDQLESMNQRAEAQIIELTTRLEEAKATIQAMRDAPPPQDPVLLLELEGLRQERARLAAALEEAQQLLREAGASRVLPEDLNRPLSRLAEANSDIMEYDAERALIRFKSDLTFPPGSAEVSPAAATGLARLARVLNTDAAADYEVRILGHTDNVPISNPGTREKHPTNWHLSVHRAIGVMEALSENGVPTSRMGVAGYGPYRPLEANTASGNAVNRRVEIVLVPLDDAPGTPTELDTPAPQTQANAAPPAATPANPDTTRVSRPLIAK